MTFPATLNAARRCQGPDVIFENEDASILANATTSTESTIASAWAAENGGRGNARSATRSSSTRGASSPCSARASRSRSPYLDKSSTKRETSRKAPTVASEALPAGFKPEPAAGER